MAVSPGERLGPYEIVDAIGAGGMGEVYKARDTRLDRVVAVKLCKEQFSERFEREARAVAALNHPNICTLHDVGPNFLVMEYIEGPTLAERIAAGPLPLAEVLPIARQIAEALEAAHEKGIVHRDLKPANIKFTPDGKVKVLDFGLAKAFDAESPAADPVNSPTLTLSATRAGVILGTASYMSPEQARGVPADKRADIWSYGVVLFEMLTGRLTFAGETVSDTLAAVLRADLEWSALPADTPAPVRRLLRRCLMRDRKQRLPDIAVARLEIDEALSGPAETPAAAPVAHEKQPLVWMAAVLLCAVTAVAVAVLHFRESPPAAPETVRLQIPLPPKTAFMGHVSISPDGRRIIFAAAGQEGHGRLWVRSLDSVEAHPLPGTEDAGYFFWSPDSRFVGYVADGRVKKVEVSGGPPQTLYANATSTLGGSWNQDGIILLGGGAAGTGISRVSSAGGTPTRLTMPDVARQEAFHAWPFFLPDGKHFLYLISGGQRESDYIYVAKLDSKLEVRDSKRLMGSRSNAIYLPSGRPDKGHLLFLRETSLMAQPFDAGRLELTGDAFPVAEQVGLYLSRGFFGAASNGTIVYRTGGGSASQLEWFDRQGQALGTVGTPGNYGSVNLSRDTTRAAVTRSDLTAGADIWLIDLLRKTSTRFTSEPGSENNPTWSPDGGRVAFSKGTRIFQKISSGAEKEEVLLESESTKRAYDWSQDGKFILYSQNDAQTRSDLWLLPLDGDRKPRPYLQTQFNEAHGQFSPDGRWIAYGSDESGRTEIYVQQFPAAGGKWQISSAGGVQPRWRGDGKELFFLGIDRTIMSVDIKTSPKFEAGVPRALFKSGALIADVRAFGYAATADGKRFLMVTAPREIEDAPLTVVLNWKGNRP